MTAGLQGLTGWTYHAAAGLVPLRDFLGALGDRVLPLDAVHPARGDAAVHAEPDLIHEVIGHGNLLVSPRFE